MKTPITILIEQIYCIMPNQTPEVKTALGVVQNFAKELKKDEKNQIVRAFNEGMRDANDNGYDYYNGNYEDRV